MDRYERIEREMFGSNHYGCSRPDPDDNGSSVRKRPPWRPNAPSEPDPLKVKEGYVYRDAQGIIIFVLDKLLTESDIVSMQSDGYHNRYYDMSEVRVYKRTATTTVSEDLIRS